MVVPTRGRNKESPPLKPGQQQHQSPGTSPRSGRGRPPHSPGRQVPGGARAMRKGGGGRRGARSDPQRPCREGPAAEGERHAVGRGPLRLLRACRDRLRGEVGGEGSEPPPSSKSCPRSLGPRSAGGGGQPFRSGGGGMGLGLASRPFFRVSVDLPGTARLFPTAGGRGAPGRPSSGRRSGGGERSEEPWPGSGRPVASRGLLPPGGVAPGAA